MDAEAATADLPILSLPWSRMQQPWKPRQRHADCAPIHQIHTQCVFRDMHVLDALRRLRSRSNHAMPVALLPTSPHWLPGQYPGQYEEQKAQRQQSKEPNRNYTHNKLHEESQWVELGMPLQLPLNCEQHGPNPTSPVVERSGKCV